MRKITKTKGVFPSDDALYKLVYLAYRNIRKKWTMPISNWGADSSAASHQVVVNGVQGCVYIIQHTVYAAGFRSTSGSLAHFTVPNRVWHVQLGVKTARHAVHCDTGEKRVRPVGFLLVFLCVKANVECRFHNSLFKLQNYCNSLRMSSMQASQIATGFRQFRTICTTFPFLFVGGAS